MTKKLRTLLNRMTKSGDSQNVTIAEFLLAQDEEDLCDDTFLLTCAEELRDSAQSILDHMRPRRKDYQIRAEWEQDGEEHLLVFSDLPTAQEEFSKLVERIRASDRSDDVHVELVEVLQQERIEYDAEEEG